MIKKLIPLITLFFITLNVQAAGILYGVTALSQNLDISYDTGTTQSEDGSGIGIYGDKYYRGTYRLSGAINYISYDNFTTLSATISADYLIPMNPMFTLFAGATAGTMGQKYDDASFSDMAMSYLVGIQFGGIVMASQNVMIEGGYRLRYTDLETEITGPPLVTATIEEFDETYLSITFLF